MPAPVIWDFRLTQPALALGSRQPIDDVVPEQVALAKLEVTHRRSGGGAVYLNPSTAVWLDVLIPSADPTFDDDLAQTFLRIGAVWQRALSVVGVTATMHQGRPDPLDELATRVCFAGLGWGELTVDGSKVVGLSQRRTRWGARVQCLADLSGAAARVGDVISLTPHERSLVHSRCGGRIDTSPDAADALRRAVVAQLALI